jgi:hypothetical protein
MNIYHYIFPIENKTQDGLFSKDIFVSNERCPTKDEMVRLLEKLISKHKEWASMGNKAFSDEYLKCLALVDDRFPVLLDNRHSIGIPIESKYGTRKLSVIQVRPIVLGQFLCT